jgi:hypothetical protein
MRFPPKFFRPSGDGTGLLRALASTERAVIMRETSGKTRPFIVAAAVLGLLMGTAGPGWADSPSIVEIEEHWELAIGAPDIQLSAPQATMVMSPTADLDEKYFLFTLNHRSVPEYLAGGAQVQLWDGDEVVEVESFNASVLDQTNDVIEWTQRLAVEDGTLTFEVTDGSSNSWGNFGDGSLAVSTPTSLANLNGYHPRVSVTESQVGYAGNRVQRLLLKRLVWRTSDGQTHELHAPIDIDTGLEP